MGLRAVGALLTLDCFVRGQMQPAMAALQHGGRFALLNVAGGALGWRWRFFVRWRVFAGSAYQPDDGDDDNQRD